MKFNQLPWTGALLSKINDGTISRTDLTPFPARQILALKDNKLSARLQEIWGDLRQTDEAKKKRIAGLLNALTPKPNPRPHRLPHAPSTGADEEVRPSLHSPGENPHTK
ncbi:MAG: hypothetical protein ACSHYF_09965 [Verrucomicrobiaceae bacterium]